MGYVYLIYDESNNVYKIGVTRNNDSNRIKKLQTGNATELRVVVMYKCEYPFRLETMLHKKFNNVRVKNEWFNLTDTDVINFKDTCDQLNQTILLLRNNPHFAKNLK